MIGVILKSIAGLILNAIFKAFGVNRDEQIGALKQANKEDAEVFDDVKKALDARDRLRSDPDYARRVRERFSRPSK